MWPTLIKIGSFEVTTFGLMMFIAFAAAAWVLSRQFRRYRLDEEVASTMTLAAAVGGILGAKIYYAILYHDLQLLFSRSGLVFYGGLIGGLLAVSFVVLRNKIPYLLAADATAPALAIGYAFGRIGCFLVGDDYGRPTNSWVGIAFPKGAPPTTAESLRAFGVKVDPSIPADTVLKVHPTQIYESLSAFVMFAILLWVARRPHRRGVPFGLFFVMIGVERFLVEILRAKDDRFFGPLTVAQIISIISIIGGTALLLNARREPVVEAAAV